MPVRSGRAHEAELVGQLDPALALVRIVDAIERLDTGEPVAMMTPQQLDAELIVEMRMRERHRGTGGTAERECVGQRERVMRNVDRTAVVEVTRERFLQ